MKYTSLKQIKELYKSIFYMEEDMILDTIISVALATKLPGDPIWLLIIGGSSSGKSELINILNRVPFVYSVSSMTENTFLSNMRLNDGKEASLLHRIGTNGIITMKDYTSILSMRSEKRDIIVSQMREIFDGKLTKEAGNGNTQKWEGKINWIGAVTDSIYIKEGESAGMGRRTINYIMPKQDRKATTRRVRKNTGDIEEKRKLIQSAVAEFIEYKLATLSKTLPELPEELEENLVDLADFITLARTPTERNFRGQLILVPDPEMPMRVFSMFQKLLQVMIHISDEQKLTPEHEKIIAKLAFDSIPKQRILTLRILAEYPSVTKKGAAQELNYPTDTMGEWLENVNVLGICQRKQLHTGAADTWEIKEEYRELMKKYLGIELRDTHTLTDSASEDEELQPTWVKGYVEPLDDKEAIKDEKEVTQRVWETF